MLMLICDVIHDVVDKHVELFTSDNQGSLHWLDVPQQVQFKLCMTVRRCMQDKAPQYLKEYCISFLDTDSRQRLRSASRHLLSVPRHRRTFGRRAFAVAGPTLWNSLPDDLRNLSRCDSYFGRFLKSVLFSFY